MVRLSYVRNQDGTTRSRPVLLNNELVQVYIYQQSKKFEVVSVNDARVIAEGRGNSEAVLTMNAKKLLKNLGVNFDGEIRRRGTNNEQDSVSTS